MSNVICREKIVRVFVLKANSTDHISMLFWTVVKCKYAFGFFIFFKYMIILIQFCLVKHIDKNNKCYAKKLILYVL